MKGSLDQIRVNWFKNCFLKFLNIDDTGSNKGEFGSNFGSLVQLQTEYHEPSLQLLNSPTLQHRAATSQAININTCYLNNK